MLDEEELPSAVSSVSGEIVDALALSSFTFSPFGNDSIGDADKRKSGDRDAHIGFVAGVKPRTRGGATEQRAAAATASGNTRRLRGLRGVAGIVLSCVGFDLVSAGRQNRIGMKSGKTRHCCFACIASCIGIIIDAIVSSSTYVVQLRT